MPVTMPAMRLSPRRCRRYISGCHDRAPDRSPRGRSAAPALSTRAVRCDLKPIVGCLAARVAAWTTAAAAPNWRGYPTRAERPISCIPHQLQMYCAAMRRPAVSSTTAWENAASCLSPDSNACQTRADESAAPRIRVARSARRHPFPSIYVPRGHRQIAG
jgi:hypothetical protein